MRNLAFIAATGILAFPWPTFAQDKDMTAFELVAAEKTCTKLTSKKKATPERLEACYDTGREYGLRGSKAVERDGTKSALYLARACDNGLGKACSLISWYYLDNSAYESSSEKSRAYDTKGCALGEATGCAGVGYWYAEEGDIEAAKKHYRKAIELKPDYEYAQKKLAELEAKDSL